MKRKKTVQPSAQQPSAASERRPAAPQLTASGRNRMDTLSVCLYTLLLFLAMTVQTGRMSVVLSFLAVACVVGRRPLCRMGERFTIPVLGLLLFMLVAGLAAIYSAFDTYALREYYKYIAGFSLTAILLLRFDRKHIRGLLWGFASVSAVISLLCIDMANHGGLFHGFNSFVELLGGSFASAHQIADAARINGIYNDANVSASILALGTLISLYLLHTEEQKRGSVAASILLGISGMGFFLSMSRGAILCFAVALLVWLLAAPGGTRMKLFCRMFFSALAILLLSFPAMPAIGTASLLPDLLAILSGGVVFLLETVLTDRLSQLLEKRRKLFFGLVGTVGAGCVAFIAAALLVTGSVQIGQTGYLNRTARLDAGAYTLSGQWEELSHVNVFWRDQTGALTDTWTELYQGSPEDACFTVSEDGGIVLVQFWGEEGTEIAAAGFSDGTELTLNRPLLPSFVNERLQDDLFMSFSYLVRVQYMKDAWTLFTQSPLIGHGLGSTEGLYTSVQPFFYESLFVHNHILQIMSDMGLLGLIPFLGILLGGLWLLLRRLKEDRDPLAAMLLACWVMSQFHGLMEINFSVRAYLCYTLPILLMVVPLCGKPVLKEKALKLAGPVTAGVCALYFAVFGGLLLSHRMVEQEMRTYSAINVPTYMAQLKSCVRRDVFVREDYQLSFVANAVALQDDPLYFEDLQTYRESLRKRGTYTACFGLARYDYLPRGAWTELFACSREGIAQEASNQDAWNLQFDFYRTEVLPAMGQENLEAYLSGVLETATYLETHNQNRIGEIVLTGDNQAFLAVARVVQEQSTFDETAYGLLTQAAGVAQ